MPRSPTSVRSPLGNSFKSESRHESEMACQYLSDSKGRPKQTLSRIVAFYNSISKVYGSTTDVEEHTCIHAFWGQYESDPANLTEPDSFLISPIKP